MLVTSIFLTFLFSSLEDIYYHLNFLQMFSIWTSLKFCRLLKDLGNRYRKQTKILYSHPKMLLFIVFLNV